MMKPNVGVVLLKSEMKN